MKNMMYKLSREAKLKLAIACLAASLALHAAQIITEIVNYLFY